MAFADPQSIKISGVVTSLPRISVGKNEATYQSADGNITLKASTQYGSRTRSVVRLDLTKITADPFIPAQNTKVSMSTYLVFDLPPAGYSDAEAKAAYEGFVEALNATSFKLITQLLGGES